MDWFGNEAKNREFDKYIHQLPEGDRDILVQHFIPVYASYRLESCVQDPTSKLKEIIGMRIEELTDRSCLKLTRIIHKAINFSENMVVHVPEPIASESAHRIPAVPSHPDISVPDNRSASELKTEGNHLYTSEQFREAIHCYSRAIVLEPDNPVYYSNRAICYIKLKLFEEALLDAEMAVSIDPHTSKYRMREALAWAGLDDHEKCCKILESLTDSSNETSSFREKEQRLAENSIGVFDFKEMGKKVERGEDVEIADYTGPVSIRYTGARGYGLFAEKIICKDEIIHVSKAVAFTRSSSDTLKKPDITHTDNANAGANNRIKLIDSLSRKAKLSTLSSHRLSYLYPRIREGAHIPIELYCSGGYEVVRGGEKAPYTRDDIDHILTYKSYSVVNDPPLAPKGTGTREERGVWYIPSFINHSCLPTAHLRFIGDIAIIQANTELLPDSEVTLSYVSVYKNATVEERARELLDEWGFVCICALCQFESNPANREKIAGAFKFRDQTTSLSCLMNNPLQIIGPAQYRLLDDVIGLAGELQLSRKMFSASVWQAILALTRLRIAPNDCSVYFQFIDRIKPYICELELTHQLVLWCNCLSYYQYIQLPDKAEIRKEADLRYQDLKARFYNVMYK